MSTTKRNQAAIGEALLLINNSTNRNYRLWLYNIGQIILLCLLQPNNEYAIDNIATFAEYLDCIDFNESKPERDSTELLSNFNLERFNAPFFNEPDEVQYDKPALTLSDTSQALIGHTLNDIVIHNRTNKPIVCACGYLTKQLDRYMGYNRQSIFAKLAGQFAALVNEATATEETGKQHRQAIKFIESNFDGSNVDPLSGVSYESK